MNIMISITKLLDYFEGVKKEFKHIRFIGKKEVYQISLLVTIAVTIFSIAFSIIDFAISNLVKIVVGF